MKLQFVSDLHLESGVLVVIPNMGSDVLVLAGDIFRAHEVRQGQTGILTDFFNSHAKAWKNIVYVMGNHEHYRGDIGLDETCIRDFLKAWPNIHVLENESVMIDGVVFWGATFWTDANKNDPVTLQILENGMNDFRVIRMNGDRFSPSVMVKLNSESLDALLEFLEDQRPCVVVTHHSPSHLTVHPWYENEHYINGGFHNNLEALIELNPNIKLWLHGHCHTSYDDMVGETRILRNPAGYPMHGGRRENPEFSPGKIVEVPQ